jgi:hypothetical protein
VRRQWCSWVIRSDSFWPILYDRFLVLADS